MDEVVQYFKNSFRENKVKKIIGVNKISFELARRKTSVFLHITRKFLIQLWARINIFQ